MKKKKLPSEILSIQFLILMSYSSMAVLTLLPLFFEHLGGSPREIGFLIGIFSLAAFLFRPFCGWILSRFDTKKVLLAGLVLILVMTSLYFLIQSLNWFVIFIRVFHGIGFSIFVLAALLTVVLVAEEEERAYAIGVVSTGFMLPLLIVPYLSEQIIERQGFFFFFLAAVFLALIPFVYVLFVRFRLPPSSPESRLESTGFFRLLKRKRILLIFLLTFIFETGLSSSLSFVPLIAHEGSSMRSGYFYTFLGLTAVFMRLYGGKKFKSWGSPGLLLPAFFFLSAGGFLIYFSFNNFILGLAGVTWGIGVGILYPHLSALVIEGVASNEKGKVLSLFAASVDLGFAFGPISFGWVSQSFGLRFTFIPFGLFVFISSLALMLWGKSTLFKKSS
ncbi:Staphylopine export protein [subsurface metagenome]